MSVRRSANAIFFEIQQLRQQRIMILVVPVGLFLIAFFAYSMVQQLIFKKPVGEDPMSNAWLMVAGTFYVLLGVFLLWLYFRGKLITEVRPEGIFIRFVPFHRTFKHISLTDIEKHEVLTYRPLRDFGGFGIRAGTKGRAYNVAGNRGVYLTFKDGKKLLIGSQKAESMAEAIASLR
ncbi:MAG: DUF6141 family protein [Candidatus Krumholzibacteria bacterium]|nr:DUF6141 family protein [Candidatus Krumholzibacteria bacterium]